MHRCMIHVMCVCIYIYIYTYIYRDLERHAEDVQFLLQRLEAYYYYYY